MEQQLHPACEWTKSNKNKTKKKPRHIHVSSQLMQWYHFTDDFTAWRQSQKEDFYAKNILLAWYLVMAQI